MNLTWHIARKDLRRFWVPLLILSAIAAMRLGVGVYLVKANSADPVSFGHIGVYANVLWGVGLFVTYMLVAAIIQEDSVASAAFWQTRPISRARLFAAKALGLSLMFGLLPVILSAPWWLGCGFGFAEIRRAAGETLAIQIVVVLLALPWAAVTGNYGRFLLWTLVAAVAWVTAAMLLAEHLVVSPSSTSPGEVVTRLLVIAMLAGLGGLGVTIHQFISRRTWRSVALIFCVAALMVATGLRWTWEASALWCPKPVAPGALEKDLKVSLESAYAYTSSPEGNTVAEVSLGATGLPAGYLVSPFYSQQNLRWADGSVSEQRRYDMWGASLFVGRANGLLNVTPNTQNGEWVRYEQRHNLIRRTPENDRKWNTQFPMILAPSEMKKLRSEKPAYDGTFWFRLLRADKVGEGEIMPGTTLENGTEHSRIVVAGFDEEKQTLFISLVERSPNYLWTDFLRAAALALPGEAPVYGVVNPNRTFMSEGYNDSKDFALIANVEITLRREAFVPRTHWNSSTHRWEKDHGGFSGATLAEIYYREADRFSLPVRVDHFAFLRRVTGQNGAPPANYTVTGEAVRPGAFPLYPGDTVVNALRFAGGVSDKADLAAVVLTHANPDGSTTQTTVNVEAWLEGKSAKETMPLLQAGDTVSVPTSAPGP